MGLLKKDGKLLLIHGTGETPSIAMAKTMGRKFKFALSNMLVAKEHKHGQDWKNSQVIKDAKNDKGFFNIVIVSDGLSTAETVEAKMIAVHIQPVTRVLLTLDEAALGKLCTSEADMERACGKGCPLYGMQEDTSPRRPNHKIKEEILSRTPCRPLKTIPIVKPPPVIIPDRPGCGHFKLENDPAEEGQQHPDSGVAPATMSPRQLLRPLKTVPVMKPAAMSCPELPLCGRPGQMPKFVLDDMATAEEMIAHQQHVRMLHYQKQEVKDSRTPTPTPSLKTIPIVKPAASCPELPLCVRDHQFKGHGGAGQKFKFALDDTSLHHQDRCLMNILLPRTYPSSPCHKLQQEEVGQQHPDPSSVLTAGFAPDTISPPSLSPGHHHLPPMSESPIPKRLRVDLLPSMPISDGGNQEELLTPRVATFKPVKLAQLVESPRHRKPLPTTQPSSTGAGAASPSRKPNPEPKKPVETHIQSMKPAPATVVASAGGARTGAGGKQKKDDVKIKPMDSKKEIAPHPRDLVGSKDPRPTTVQERHHLPATSDPWTKLHVGMPPPLSTIIDDGNQELLTNSLKPVEMETSPRPRDLRDLVADALALRGSKDPHPTTVQDLHDKEEPLQPMPTIPPPIPSGPSRDQHTTVVSKPNRPKKLKAGIQPRVKPLYYDIAL